MSGQGTGSVSFANGDFDDFPFLPGFHISASTDSATCWIAITSSELPRRLHFMPLPQLDRLNKPEYGTGSSLITVSFVDERCERGRLPAVGPETRWRREWDSNTFQFNGICKFQRMAAGKMS
jgi:hypothetical protein